MKKFKKLLKRLIKKLPTLSEIGRGASYAIFR